MHEKQHPDSPSSGMARCGLIKAEGDLRHNPRFDTSSLFWHNAHALMPRPSDPKTNDPFPYHLIQRMEHQHGFKVTEEEMDVAISIAKKLCCEQGRVFDLAALSEFILFAATKRAIVMSVPPEDREQFLTAWNTRLKAEGRAELIVEEDDLR